MSELAPLLRLARKGRKLRLADVAKWSGLSVSFISEIERGVASPSLESLEKLLRVYGCQLTIEEIPMTNAVSKPILCVDFDGVLHSYSSGWKGATVIPDPPVPGAIAFLYEAIFAFDVHIYSSRSHQEGGIDAMQEWIHVHENAWRELQAGMGLPLPKTALLLNLHWPTEKPPAFLTIDDRAITFTGEWPAIDALRAFKPWHKPRSTQQRPDHAEPGRAAEGRGLRD
jgi:transcriptional regulator with XRE-family HTH domain